MSDSFPMLPILSYFRFSYKRSSIFLTCSSASKQTQAKTFVESPPVFWESSVSWLLTPSKEDFSVFRLSFKFYSGRMKTNTQRYPMFAILAPSPSQCVAFCITLCKELLVVFLSLGRRAGPAGILFWRKALCKAPFPGK